MKLEFSEAMNFIKGVFTNFLAILWNLYVYGLRGTQDKMASIESELEPNPKVYQEGSGRRNPIAMRNLDLLDDDLSDFEEGNSEGSGSQEASDEDVMVDDSEDISAIIDSSGSPSTTATMTPPTMDSVNDLEAEVDGISDADTLVLEPEFGAYEDGTGSENEYWYEGISEGSLVCVKAINETLNAPYRLDYNPPLIQEPLMFWTEHDYGIIKEFVRLFPAAFPAITKLQMAEDGTPEYSQEKLAELEAEYKRSTSTIEEYQTKSIKINPSDSKLTHPQFRSSRLKASTNEDDCNLKANRKCEYREDLEPPPPLYKPHPLRHSTFQFQQQPYPNPPVYFDDDYMGYYNNHLRHSRQMEPIFNPEESLLPPLTKGLHKQPQYFRQAPPESRFYHPNHAHIEYYNYIWQAYERYWIFRRLNYLTYRLRQKAAAIKTIQYITKLRLRRRQELQFMRQYQHIPCIPASLQYHQQLQNPGIRNPGTGSRKRNSTRSRSKFANSNSESHKGTNWGTKASMETDSARVHEPGLVQISQHISVAGDLQLTVPTIEISSKAFIGVICLVLTAWVLGSYILMH